MKCKKCGIEIDFEIALSVAREEKQNLEKDLEIITTRIEALEQGYCDVYCRYMGEKPATGIVEIKVRQYTCPKCHRLFYAETLANYVACAECGAVLVKWP